MASATIEAMTDGRWRVRWRVKVDGRWKSREKTVHGSKTDAESYRLRVLASLEETGAFDIDADRAAHAPPANLIEGLMAYVKAMEADGALRDAARYERQIVRVARAIHEHTGIPASEPLPVTLLSRPLFDALKPKWSRATARNYLGFLFRGWQWLADDPTSWPKVPPCPRVPVGYVPRKVTLGRTVAPTLEHVDAFLRAVRARVEANGRGGRGGNGKLGTVIFCMLARYTGLRSSQILAIHREDLDLAGGWLTVRKGKSEREQADMRTVPLSRSLMADPLFKEWAANLPETGPVLRVAAPRKTSTAAWEDATSAGEVPRSVWAPANRSKARPIHAFRAALRSALLDARHPVDAVDFLIGHAPSSVGDAHYGRDLLKDAREAVDDLPPVDWHGQGVEAHNVVRLAR